MAVWIGDTYENTGYDPKYTLGSDASAARQSAIKAQLYPNVADERMDVVSPFIPRNRGKKPRDDR